MREQEKLYIERKKAEMKSQMEENEHAVFAETVAPTMAEVSLILENAGDTQISDAGLEAIARWKLGM